MNCVANQSNEQTNGRSQVVIAFIASQTTTVSDNTGNPAIAYAHEMQRRAETITAVLDRIMHEPAQLRDWGLNE